MSQLKQRLREIRAGENLELNLLLLISLVTVGLDVTNIAPQSFIIGIIPPLLALVAVSQLRVHQDLAMHRIAPSASSVLLSDFPSDYYDRRSTARHEWTYLGITMGRTLSTGRPTIERLLMSGGAVTVVLPDPNDPAMMSMIARTRSVKIPANDVERSIRHAFQTLTSIAESTGGTMTLLVTNVLPRCGYNGIDASEEDGLIMVHYYEFEPRGESGPIVLLRPSDGGWYLRYREHAERVVRASSVWAP